MLFLIFYIKNTKNLKILLGHQVLKQNADTLNNKIIVADKRIFCLQIV